LLTFVPRGHRSIPDLKKHLRTASQAVLAGWLGYVVAMSLLLVALSLGDVGLVAVLGSTVPVMLIPVVWVVTKKPPTGMSLLGATLVVAGAALIAQ